MPTPGEGGARRWSRVLKVAKRDDVEDRNAGSSGRTVIGVRRAATAVTAGLLLALTGCGDSDGGGYVVGSTVAGR